MSSCMRKCPWVPEAREALCANQPPLTVDDERSSHNRRERHSPNPWNLRVSFISNLFQPENVTIFVKVAYKRRAATGSPLTTFLQRSSRSPLSVLWASWPVMTTGGTHGGPDWTEKKKPGQR